MAYWCGCCSTCQPRYRRLVDSIYPSVPDGGLVKNNMQKLSFYVASHPEKLDRVSAYLTYRLGRDIYRQRMGFIFVAVEAMNQLLANCRASPSLNLYVENFLKMVSQLLETALPELELMATESFVNFADTEEDAPSYHRRYDFFISKFSSLCHNSAADLTVRQKLRVAGIKGLRGLVRKTATDDLQANIWEKPQMDKIVPSLLFNMHDPFSVGCVVPTGVDGPHSLAAACFKEMIGKASFGNIKYVLNPILNHIDNHQLWTPPIFAVTTFEAVMLSVQSQYSYVVIQSLMSHLDKHANDSASVRCGIATVLSRIVVAAAAASIGPSLLEIFNNVLRHIRQSVEVQSHNEDRSKWDGEDDRVSEKVYQDTLIDTIANFAENSPDYQKTEIMVFIINKIPPGPGYRMSDNFLQKALTRTLLQVATKYRTGYLGTVLTVTFLEPLLKLSLAQDGHVRLLVQQTLHTLIDRHQNLQPLLQLASCQVAADWEHLDPTRFTMEKLSRADLMFVHKFGDKLLHTLCDAAMMANNDRCNFDAIFVTMSLLLMEIGCEGVILDLFRMVLALQEAAQEADSSLSLCHKLYLKQLVARYVFLMSTLLSFPSLNQRCLKLLRECADVDMPDVEMNRSDPVSVHAEDVFILEPEAADLMLDVDAIDNRQLSHTPWLDKQEVIEFLKLRDYDVTRLNQPFLSKKAESVKLSAKSAISSSRSSGHQSMESVGSRSTKGFPRRTEAMLEYEGTTFPSNVDGLRQVLAQATDTWVQKEQERCRQTVSMFQTLPFSTLIEMQRRNRSDLNATVQRLFNDGDKTDGAPKVTKTMSNIKFEFPQLFVR